MPDNDIILRAAAEYRDAAGRTKRAAEAYNAAEQALRIAEEEQLKADKIYGKARARLLACVRGETVDA